MATEQDAKNKKELEEALSTLSVEEQELKKQEEEFKTKEKVLNISLKHFCDIYSFVE